MLILLEGLQFPSTKRRITELPTIEHISTGGNCIIGSNIHHVSADQADNDQFGAGVNVAIFLTVGYHVVEGSRVHNDLCVDV